jgi:hypothetical protein
MFVNSKKASERLRSHRNVLVSMGNEVIKEQTGLKTFLADSQVGDTSVPEMMRNVIGAAATFEPCRDVAAEFGVGKTQANEHARALAKKVDVLAPARELAINKMTKALEGISSEKLQDLGAKTLSEVARNVSSVVRNVTPEKKDEDTGRYTLNIFTPRAMGFVPTHKTRDFIDVGVVQGEVEA